jgi:actin-related protein
MEETLQFTEDQQQLETGGAGASETTSSDQNESRNYSEEEVQNLLKALKAERESRKIYEKEVKEKSQQLEKFAQINPDEYRKLQEEAAIAAREKAAADERTALLEEKYGAQAAEALKQRDERTKELLEFRKRYALEKVFFAAGGRTDSADGVSFFDMLANQIGNQFRLEPDGNITVVDYQGDPVLDKDSGRRITPEDYLSKFKTHAIYGTFFKGNKGSGAGIGYGGTNASGMPTEDLHALSSEELFQKAFG